VDDARLAYRVRTAEAADEPQLRAAIAATLDHPDGQGRRASYRGAAARGDILVLERFDRQERAWQLAGFVECHMRVDDTLTIRDIGTATEEPQAGVVRYLLDQALASYRPVAAQVKVRRDAGAWLDILGAIPGFAREGEEYRRPHYWTIWQWEPQRARAAEQERGRGPEPARRADRGPRRPPPPPHQPRPPQRGGTPAGAPRQPAPRRPRPGGSRPTGSPARGRRGRPPSGGPRSPRPR
jgi:hypothetical protein